MNKILKVLLDNKTRYYSIYSNFYLKNNNKIVFNSPKINSFQAKTLITNNIDKSLEIIKKDKITKRKKQKKINDEKNHLKVIAVSTAESYDLVKIKNTVINEGVYEILNDTISNDADRDFLFLNAKYKSAITNEDESRMIFIFSEGNLLYLIKRSFKSSKISILIGTCIFWNINDKKEQDSILNLIRADSNKSFDDDLIDSESEVLTYSIENDIKQTNLNKNHIYFSINSSNQIVLEKYALSDSISSSIKLGILESNLENFIESVEHVSENLKNGKKFHLSSADILQKTGRLLSMRHMINLRFDLLNTPDYYWDREELEKLYTRSNSFLDIKKRTDVFNQKLNFCIDLMRILEANLNDKKHIRLEWIIIVLISIEAVIGMLSLFK